MAPAIDVLYIAGWQRSGSTILANILGATDGFFSAGELHYLWDYVWFDDIRCGCGRPFSDCPVWTAVLAAAYGGRDGVDPEAMLRLGTTGTRTRNMPLLALPTTRRVLTSRIQPYLSNLARLYRGLSTVTGAAVIVDSSKWPSYGRLLTMIPELNVFVVHLVRDPRAVAHSWLRRTALPDRDGPAFMYRRPLDSSLRWNVWNAATEAFWRSCPHRYVRLRYEDFVARPEDTVRSLLDFVGQRGRALPFTAPGEVDLPTIHTVSGNPARFRTGPIRIGLDEEWRMRMGWTPKVTVTAVTAPILHRYGYPLRAGASTMKGALEGTTT
jgi:Sulfotransferase family